MQFLVHVYHAIHHKGTTNSPQRFATISKTPLKNANKFAKNPCSTTRVFFCKNWSRSDAEKFRSRSCQCADKLSEQSIGPRKPRPRKPPRIILVIALVHKTKSLGGAFQHPQRTANLACIAAGKRINNLRHRPDHPVAYMRPANPFSRRPAKEPGIALTPAQRSGARIKPRIR